MRSASGGGRREQALGVDRVVAPVTEGVAAQHAPRGQHQAAKYAELLQRLDARRPSTSARTCSGAAARARSRAGRRRSAPARRARRPSCRARPLEQLAQRAAHARQALALGELAAPTGRATTTTSWPAGTTARLGVEGLAQQPLDEVAVDGAADLARHRQPEPRLLVGRRRAETRRRRGGGCRASGPGDRRARTRRCATGARGAARARLGTRGIGSSTSEQPRASGRPGPAGRGAQTVSFLRPLARRRLRTRRPDFVCIR